MGRIIFFRKQAVRSGLLFVVAAVCSAALFLLCFHLDNKYTQEGPQPHRGTLVLTEQDLHERPVLHLVMDWEIYRGKLLTPEDFVTSVFSPTLRFAPDEYVFIGQYGGFEGNAGSGGSRGPHGSATYRLVIELPPEPDNYMLELPEIYSSYRLYVNGELLAQMGNPDREGYYAQTGNARVGIRCSSRMEIILAVSDFSHFYSGFVYPPAFGLASNVEGMLNSRFAIRVTAVALALGVGLFYLVVWFLLKKSKDKSAGSFLPLLYASLCACFSVYIGYPVTKTLWNGGLLWYTLESAAFPAMLLFASMIQSRVTGFPERFARFFAAFGIFICSVAAITPFIMGDNLTIMIAYSDVLEIYSWACALFLLVNAVYGIYRDSYHSTIILLAAVTFAMSLALDRFLPLFEPMLFGWFSELSGAVFVVSIGAVMAKEVAGQFHKRLALELWTESVENRIQQQEEQFMMIADSADRAIKARHDLRHHLSTLRGLLDSGNLDGLKRHLSEYAQVTAADIGKVYCANARVNALIGYYSARAREIGAYVDIKVNLPHDRGGSFLTLPSDLDLCVVFGNCLENAVAACKGVPQEKRFIRLRCSVAADSLVIILNNSFDGKPPVELDGRYKSSKRDDWGIGLASVMGIAEKYGGMAVFSVEGNEFQSEIDIPLGV